MGRELMFSMEVKSKNQLRWAKEMLIATSVGAGCDSLEYIYGLDVDEDEIIRYHNETLTEEEQEKFAAGFAKAEAQQNIEWDTQGKKITAFPEINDECFAYMGGYYGLFKEIVRANPKREFIFNSYYTDDWAGVSSDTYCKVEYGKFSYETSEVHPWNEDPVQIHAVKGKLVNGKYEFEVVSEFDDLDDFL